MPLQVLIEATIIEVRLSDRTKYGVSWGIGNNRGVTVTKDAKGELTGEAGGSGAARGMAQLGKLAAAAASGASSGGFSYVISNVTNTVQAAIDAFGSGENINVLSTPSLLVLNNQEASIHVGDKVPVRGETRSFNGTAPTSDTNNSSLVGSIDSVQTGVTLNVTPRVNANGVVIMDIVQENNNATSTTTSRIDSPTIVERKLETSIAIYSGETVVLGGLISETYNDSTTGIPWFKDLPYVGVLFGETERVKQKSELIVLITPRVIQNKADARRETRRYQLRLPGLYEIDDELKDISGELKQLKEHQNLPN
jgi:general secretion pathway protein D